MGVQKLFGRGALVALFFTSMLGGCSMLEEFAEVLASGKIVKDASLRHVSSIGREKLNTQAFVAGDRLELVLVYAKEEEQQGSTQVRVEVPSSSQNSATSTLILSPISLQSSRLHKLSYTLTARDVATMAKKGSLTVVPSRDDLVALGCFSVPELEKDLS